MKLIEEFKNQYDNITYKVYETDSKIKVLHLDNPSTINFDFASIHTAGSAFEIQEGVPRGTAHFLEHMLLNPNSFFKTQDEINLFEQGSKDRPALDINAYTNRKNIVFTANSNEKGTLRILDRIEKIYDFPKEKFSKLIEKERGIILAEKSRKLKKEKDNYLMSLDFFYKNIGKEFTGDGLGEVKDINMITVDNLEKYYKNRITLGNTMFSIQSNGNLSKDVINGIERISKRLTTKKSKNLRDIELINKWNVGAFSEKRENGVSVSFNYFEKDDIKTNYKKSTTSFVCAKLLEWLTYNILREQKSLIYNFTPSKSTYLSFTQKVYSLKFTTEREKVAHTLDEYYNLLHNTTFNFLRNKKGKEWFDDVISSYIFPKTSSYDETLAERVAPRLLENKDIFNHNLAVKEAKELKIDDIERYLREQLEIPPHIWIEGNMSKDELIKVINNSLFSKRFNK